MTYNISHEWYSKDTPVGPIDCLRIKVEFVTDWVNDCRTEQYEYEMLPDYVQDGNYDIGQGHEYPGSEDRRKRLSLASPNIWQVGWYLPTGKFRGSPNYHEITNHILKNKEQGEKYAKYLAYAMYHKAEKYKFGIFDANFIVPVPNFDLNDDTVAVSISKQLVKIMNDKGHNVEFQNLLIKTKNVKTHGMNRIEKEKFYSENQLYEFNKKYSGRRFLHGKKVILVDDVVTQGFAAEQCLKELSNQGTENLCFYSVGTTKWGR